MNTREILMLAAVVLATAAGHLLLRNAAPKWIRGRGWKPFLKSFFIGTGPWSALCVLGAPFLYWKILESVDLSTAYVMVSLTAVLVLIGSTLILKERASPRAIVGAILCIVGIAAWAL